MPVDDKLYNILKVLPNATEKEFIKSYRKLAMKWHNFTAKIAASISYGLEMEFLLLWSK